MHSNYNINQLSLNMATFYEPEKNHQAHYIHHLVESIVFDDSYTFGRP
ncbi:transposase, partial [Lactobacillus murinus]|nr:transposase [Ligilactobacillus murinus]NDO26800.1 transposase [Ligilactobacillus murinus]